MQMIRKSFRRWEAEVALLFTAILWGLTFPLIRLGIQSVGPYYFVAFRFILATLVLLPILLWRKELNRAVMKNFLPMAGLGIVGFLIFFCQTAGLETVPAPRGAFLSGTFVLFVPLLTLALERRSPLRMDWLSAFIALCGLYFMVDPQFGGFSWGDGLIVFASFGIALHIHLIQKMSKGVTGPLLLAFLQIFGIALIATVILPLTPHSYSFEFNWKVILSVLVCGLGVSTGTLFLQAKYQKRTSPERASLFFAFEPIFGALFAYMLVSETLSVRSMFGALLIMIATLLPLFFEGRAAKIENAIQLSTS